MISLPHSKPDLSINTGDDLTEDYKQYPLATFRQRAFAIFLDGFFVGIIFGLLNIGIKYVLNNSWHHGRAGPILLLISFVFTYYIFPLYGSGETLGKRLVGVRVVSEEGDGRLGFLQILGRETLGKLLSGCCVGLGYAGAITRKDRKTFHDRIFSTRVITFR
jgi:uncharacterized RDD family membrane protein YckC